MAKKTDRAVTRAPLRCVTHTSPCISSCPPQQYATRRADDPHTNRTMRVLIILAPARLFLPEVREFFSSSWPPARQFSWGYVKPYGRLLGTKATPHVFDAGELDRAEALSIPPPPPAPRRRRHHGIAVPLRLRPRPSPPSPPSPPPPPAARRARGARGDARTTLAVPRAGRAPRRHR